ncbi:MAG: 3-hydroxyacyl-CoA dehydrogenase NAD-binding domain-containing protein, partial [Candidatus Acidiferrales bacterium]
MKRSIEKVVVLGAGTMGARIAAHVANAGVWCALLDIVPRELTAEETKRGLTLESPAVRNRIVHAGLAAAAKSRPAAFFTRGLENRILAGNFEDDLKL